MILLAIRIGLRAWRQCLPVKYGPGEGFKPVKLAKADDLDLWKKSAILI